MSYKYDIIKERFDLDITTANEIVKAEFELDNNASHLFGIAVTSDREDLLYFRGSQKIQLNDKELFPEDFESKLLMTGLSVPPNQRMVKIGRVETGGRIVEVAYKDQDHPNGNFVPYRISFYFFSVVK